MLYLEYESNLSAEALADIETRGHGTFYSLAVYSILHGYEVSAIFNTMNRKFWTTVTPFSAGLALVLFIILPIVGFILGMHYQRAITVSTGSTIEESLK